MQVSIITNLHTILKPFLLRRLKTEVAKELPMKKEYIIYAPLTIRQKELYTAALKGVDGLREEIISQNNKYFKNVTNEVNEEVESEDEETEGNVNKRKSKKRKSTLKASVNYDDSEDDDTYFDRLENLPAIEVKKHETKSKPISQLRLQTMFMQLRKVCNHPFLFDFTVNPENLPDFNNLDDEENEQQKYVLTEYEKNNIVTCSGKIMILERLIPALFERGHKVLIFCQMTKMLDIIQDWCMGVKGWQAARIDGGVKLEERKRQIEEFNKNPEMKIFLLSTRAGGLGINLTAADTVILYDSDWNPQMDLQAQDRAHRIGQTKPVVVYRLISSNSIESRILVRAGSKRKLEKLVIHEVSELAAILAQEESEAIKNFQTTDINPLPESVLCDEDLERILDRSANNMQSSLDEGVGYTVEPDSLKDEILASEIADEFEVDSKLV
ncbi:hypothetical protein HK096_008532 [Nowakowskiella sp. JEL0078]|nr:hypothetical protein HK096_008532 [Nowakowskiella sp. JEL0078]